MAPNRPDQASVVTVEFLRELYAVARASNDYVVIDTPPGFTPEVIATIDASTDIVMVGMLDSLSLKNTKLGLETLDLMGYRNDRISLVLNRADSRVGITGRDVTTIVGRKPDILVPSDREIPRAVNEGLPIVSAKRNSEAAKSFRALAAILSQPREHEPAGGREGVGSTRRPDALAGKEGVDGTSRATHDDTTDCACGWTRPLLGGQEPGSLRPDRRARPAALQRHDGSGRAARSGDGGRSSSSRPGGGSLSRGPRAAGCRDRGRRARARSARAAPERRQRHGGHGQRPGRGVGRASGAAVRDERALHRRVASAQDHQQDRRAGRAQSRRVVAARRRSAS